MGFKEDEKQKLPKEILEKMEEAISAGSKTDPGDYFTAEEIFTKAMDGRHNIISEMIAEFNERFDGHLKEVEDYVLRQLRFEWPKDTIKKELDEMTPHKVLKHGPKDDFIVLEGGIIPEHESRGLYTFENNKKGKDLLKTRIENEVSPEIERKLKEKVLESLNYKSFGKPIDDLFGEYVKDPIANKIQKLLDQSPRSSRIPAPVYQFASYCERAIQYFIS